MDVEEFKEDLLDIVVQLGEPLLMVTGLDKEAREKLPSERMANIRETRPNTELRSCKDSSTLKKKEVKKLGLKMMTKINPLL